MKPSLPPVLPQNVAWVAVSTVNRALRQIDSNRCHSTFIRLAVRGSDGDDVVAGCPTGRGGVNLEFVDLVYVSSMFIMLLSARLWPNNLHPKRRSLCKQVLRCVIRHSPANGVVARYTLKQNAHCT